MPTKTYFNPGCALSVYKPEMEKTILDFLNQIIMKHPYIKYAVGMTRKNMILKDGMSNYKNILINTSYPLPNPSQGFSKQLFIILIQTGFSGFIQLSE